MMEKQRKLTKLDIKYISKLIGHEPNEYELDLIECVNDYELNNRKYLGVLARLNHGANRKIDEKIQIEHDKTLGFINGIKIIDDKKLIHHNNQSEKDLDIISLNDIITNYTVIGNDIKLNFLEKEIDKSKSIISIKPKSDYNSSKQIVFESTVGFENKENDISLKNIQNYFVYKVDIGKNNKKNNKIIKKFIADGLTNNWFIKVRYKSNNGLGSSLIKLFKNIDHGITFAKKISFNSLIERNDDLSLLIIMEKLNYTKLRNYCTKNGLSVNRIGELVDDSIIQLNEKNETIINLPFSVFDLQYDINTKHYEEPIQQKYESSEQIKGVDKTSLSNQLLKIFGKIIENNFNMYNGNKVYKKYGISTDTKELDNQLTIITADSNNLLNIAPRMSGKMAIANAVRKMACLGVKTNFVVIHDLFPRQDKQYFWQASEILQGQEEAIRALELTIGSRKIDTLENCWQQNVTVIGQSKQNQLADIAFKGDGDFISLLGSHRGELVGSEYQKYISDKLTNVLPSVDLNMEARLADVVQQGINTKLLKSATNVSLGGISIAIAMSLAASAEGIGAKIHLSRKLSAEELLFGETQGLVVVTLAEEDIMEFERICMTVGVPSTTIGRVTDNNTYTFNDSINIKVDKLKEMLT